MLVIDSVCVFFFFKQKTAYEMRISDWSSDVCSSDLLAGELFHGPLCPTQRRGRRKLRDGHHVALVLVRHEAAGHPAEEQHGHADQTGEQQHAEHRPPQHEANARSEEHTSELQSLMRISYAVFCLKKKKTKKHTQNRSTIKQTR